MDFAEARIYENRFGRFTAVDPLLASGKSANPQTFNRFIYVGNNPIMITDPSGLDWYRTAYSSGSEPHRWKYEWFGSKPTEGNWEPVDFGDNVFLPIEKWMRGETSMGTGYLDRYSNNILTQAQFSAAASSYRAFQPGGGCYANPQCSGLRNPINDNVSVLAAEGGAQGYPMGFLNAAKSSIDLPNWNMAPPPLNLFITDSLSTRGLANPWFNYSSPNGPYQRAGATGGAMSFNLVTIFATKSMGGSLSRPYTSSYAGLGQQMHREYKVAEQMANVAIKEFRLPSGRRIDFLDIRNKTIYELKPYNPRQMNLGYRQLELYKQELQTIPRFSGFKWKTVLDTY